MHNILHVTEAELQHPECDWNNVSTTLAKGPGVHTTLAALYVYKSVSREHRRHVYKHGPVLVLFDEDECFLSGSRGIPSTNADLFQSSFLDAS